MSLKPISVTGFTAKTRMQEIDRLYERLYKKHGLILRGYSEITDPLFFKFVTQRAENGLEIEGKYIVATRVGKDRSPGRRVLYLVTAQKRPTKQASKKSTRKAATRKTAREPARK